jgi:chromosome segregation ATPase
MNAIRVIKSASFFRYQGRWHIFGIAPMIVLVAGMMWLCGNAHAAKLYKWVDENGMVHFSDSIPPQEIKKQHSEIDTNGFETRSVEAAKTPAEIEEMKRQQALKDEQERLAKERAEQDRILLDTFSSEDEIIAARDRQIATIEASNQLTLGSIDSLTHKLQEQTGRAADYERQGQDVPQGVLDEIDKIKRQIEMRRASIRTRKDEQRALKEKYQAYVDRFRELKNSNLNL